MEKNDFLISSNEKMFASNPTASYSMYNIQELLSARGTKGFVHSNQKSQADQISSPLGRTDNKNLFTIGSTQEGELTGYLESEYGSCLWVTTNAG